MHTPAQSQFRRVHRTYKRVLKTEMRDARRVKGKQAVNELRRQYLAIRGTLTQLYSTALNQIIANHNLTHLKGKNNKERGEAHKVMHRMVDSNLNTDNPGFANLLQLQLILKSAEATADALRHTDHITISLRKLGQEVRADPGLRNDRKQLVRRFRELTQEPLPDYG